MGDVEAPEVAPVARAESAQLGVDLAKVVDDKLDITVHLAVFYGYPFTKLAEDVRTSVAEAIRGQVGYEVGNIDVCIDSLVFPKE